MTCGCGNLIPTTVAPVQCTEPNSVFLNNIGTQFFASRDGNYLSKLKSVELATPCNIWVLQCKNGTCGIILKYQTGPFNVRNELFFVGNVHFHTANPKCTENVPPDVCDASIHAGMEQVHSCKPIPAILTAFYASL